MAKHRDKVLVVESVEKIAQDMETLNDLSQISEAYAVIDQTRRGIGVASPEAIRSQSR